MKRAEFFCESCNRPVRVDAQRCPHCGSRFTAVACPKCSFVGKPQDFGGGCPRCGYLAPELQRTRVSGGRPSGARLSGRTSRRGDGGRRTLRPGSGRRPAGRRFPPWFYTLSAVSLLVALVVLIFLAARAH